MEKQKRGDTRAEKSAENNMSAQEQWMVLGKSLYIRGATDINEEIAKTVRHLKKLEQMKANGVFSVRRRRRVKKIDGIGIIYAKNGLNKEIAYEAAISEPEDVFAEKVKRIFGILKKDGYKPILCRKRIKIEIGKGAKCDI